MAMAAKILLIVTAVVGVLGGLAQVGQGDGAGGLLAGGRCRVYRPAASVAAEGRVATADGHLPRTGRPG